MVLSPAAAFSFLALAASSLAPSAPRPVDSFAAAMAEVCPAAIVSEGAALSKSDQLAANGFAPAVSSAGLIYTQADSFKVAYNPTEGQCSLHGDRIDGEVDPRFVAIWREVAQKVHPDVALDEALEETYWVPPPMIIRSDSYNVSLLLSVGHINPHNDIPETYVFIYKAVEE